jgi:hypothetical protein
LAKMMALRSHFIFSRVVRPWGGLLVSGAKPEELIS